MRSRTAGVLVGAVSLLAALLVARFWPAKAPKPKTIELSQLESKLQAELDETRRDLASMKRTQALLVSNQLATRASEGSAQASGPEAQDAELPAPPDQGAHSAQEVDEEKLQEIMEREEALTEVRYGKLEAELATEPRDNSWASEVENSYRSRLAAFDEQVRGTKPHIVSLECRTSICRLELSFTNASDAEQYGAELSSNALIKRGTIRQLQSGGEVRTIAFLARDGRTLHPLRPNEPLEDG